MSLSSARSITAAANPPRALYLDFPLGRTAGKPGDLAMQLAIMQSAIEVLGSADTSGRIVDLPYRWREDDDWKDGVMRPSKKKSGRKSMHEDDRVQRFDTPQYQLESDVPDDASAEACDSCVFLAAD